MSLPMLVNGADCGPVNPLQGLAKRFDQDRGLQQVSVRNHESSACPKVQTYLQDFFGAGRASSSREVRRAALLLS